MIRRAADGLLLGSGFVRRGLLGRSETGDRGEGRGRGRSTLRVRSTTPESVGVGVSDEVSRRCGLSEWVVSPEDLCLPRDESPGRLRPLDDLRGWI